MRPMSTPTSALHPPYQASDLPVEILQMIFIAAAREGHGVAFRMMLVTRATAAEVIRTLYSEPICLYSERMTTVFLHGPPVSSLQLVQSVWLSFHLSSSCQILRHCPNLRHLGTSWRNFVYVDSASDHSVPVCLTVLGEGGEADERHWRDFALPMPKRCIRGLHFLDTRGTEVVQFFKYSCARKPFPELRSVCLENIGVSMSNRQAREMATEILAGMILHVPAGCTLVMKVEEKLAVNIETRCDTLRSVLDVERRVKGEAYPTFMRRGRRGVRWDALWWELAQLAMRSFVAGAW